jgi:hypothetical protein
VNKGNLHCIIFWWRKRFYICEGLLLFYCNTKHIQCNSPSSLHTSLYALFSCLHLCPTSGWSGSCNIKKKIIVHRFEVLTAVLLRPDTLTLGLCFSIFLKEYGALVFNSWGVQEWCLLCRPANLTIKCCVPPKCQETLPHCHSVKLQKHLCLSSSFVHHRLFYKLTNNRNNIGIPARLRSYCYMLPSLRAYYYVLPSLRDYYYVCYSIWEQTITYVSHSLDVHLSWNSCAKY